MPHLPPHRKPIGTPHGKPSTHHPAGKTAPHEKLRVVHSKHEKPTSRLTLAQERAFHHALSKAGLSEREMQFVHLRFSFDKGHLLTPSDIAYRMDCTVEEMHRIEAHAFAKMRKIHDFQRMWIELFGNK